MLRGYIRELEKNIRSLQKQLRSYEKYERVEHEVISDSEDTFPKDVKLTKDCSICGKGKMVETLEIMGKTYGECANCGTKGRIK